MCDMYISLNTVTRETTQYNIGKVNLELNEQMRKHRRR